MWQFWYNKWYRPNNHRMLWWLLLHMRRAVVTCTAATCTLPLLTSNIQWLVKPFKYSTQICFFTIKGVRFPESNINTYKCASLRGTPTFISSLFGRIANEDALNSSRIKFCHRGPMITNKASAAKHLWRNHKLVLS
jgi:hypothetical protein